MKKIILVAVMMLVVVSTVSAEVSGSISTKVLSRYVANQGSVLHNKAVQQTDFFLSLPEGFYADIWVSLPWDDKNNLAKEVDWTIGWTKELSSTRVIVDVGVSYFDFIDLFKANGDIVNPYMKVSKDFTITEKQSLTPYVKVETPIPTKDNEPAGGIYTYIGAKYSLKVSKRIFFIHEAYVLYDNGVYELDKGWVGKYSATASVELSKGITFDISLSLFTPISSLSDRETEFIPAFGLTYGF